VGDAEVVLGATTAFGGEVGGPDVPRVVVSKARVLRSQFRGVSRGSCVPGGGSGLEEERFDVVF
jgi:hypothetical protein